MNRIKVYGTGCANCKKLEAMCVETIAELKIDASVEKVSEIEEIVKSGIMRTPGLEINGKIISAGKIPTKETLIHWIRENTN